MLSGFLSTSFGNPSLIRWQVIAWKNCRSELNTNWISSWIWPWRSRSISPKTIGTLTHGYLDQYPWRWLRFEKSRDCVAAHGSAPKTIGFLQSCLHVCLKFYDPSLNGTWVVARTGSWLTNGHAHTHIHSQINGIRQCSKAKTGIG